MMLNSACCTQALKVHPWCITSPLATQIDCSAIMQRSTHALISKKEKKNHLCEWAAVGDFRRLITRLLPEITRPASLEISVAWSEGCSRRLTSPGFPFSESDCPGRFPFSESDRSGRFRRSIKTRNCPFRRMHGRTNAHTCCNYI
jgi:hypothetical protein